MKVGHLIILVTLIIATLAIATATLPTHGQQDSNYKGFKNEKQKAHSKLYGEYSSGRTLRKETEEKGDVLIKRNVGLAGGDVGYVKPTLSQFLQRMACEADAVVLGTVKEQSSYLTENEKFISTDYEVEVNEVIKNNAAAYISPNATITVTRPGGTVKLDGKTAQAIDESYENLAGDEQYVLFLKFIPDTGAYQAYGGDSGNGFEVRGKKVRNLTKEYTTVKSEIAKINALSFLNEIRTSSVSDCRNIFGGMQ